MAVEHKSGPRELDSVRDFVRGLKRLDTDGARLRAFSYAWAQAFDEREAETSIALGFYGSATKRRDKGAA
jgi:hypothetical protein